LTIKTMVVVGSQLKGKMTHNLPALVVMAGTHQQGPLLVWLGALMAAQTLSILGCSGL
jgi:hypothetical protein